MVDNGKNIVLNINIPKGGKEMQEYFIIYRRKAPKADQNKKTELQREVVKGDSIYQAVRAFHDKHDSNECDIKAVLERDLVADISRLL